MKKIKDITFVAKDLIDQQRQCTENCGAEAAKAKPQKKSTLNHLNRIQEILQ